MGFAAVDFFVSLTVGAEASLDFLHKPECKSPLFVSCANANGTFNAFPGHGTIMIGDILILHGILLVFGVLCLFLLVNTPDWGKRSHFQRISV
jgi:hypothetical protein